jgi:outer membrane receptor protein involved in Fe transport
MKKHFFVLSLAAVSALYSADGVFDLGKIDVNGVGEATNSTITVIDAQEIQDQERKTIVEALNLLPGATIQNFGARNEQMIMIRGFDVKHAPLYIDGIPIAVPYDGYVDFSRFTTFDLSQIEVSKGLTSPLLGANTFAGAINLVTKKPTKSFEGIWESVHSAEMDVPDTSIWEATKGAITYKLPHLKRNRTIIRYHIIFHQDLPMKMEGAETIRMPKMIKSI